ncbi:MAG: TonB family protein [Gammaproteobacteria bacterium]|nr:TonB family protein [Gammaproteobacteria bacterium]
MHTLRLPSLTLPRVTLPTVSNVSERMTIAVFVAVVAHLIVVLGVSFEDEPKPAPAASPLDILLVQPDKKVKPADDTELLANQSQDGSGENREPLPNPTTRAGQRSVNPARTTHAPAEVLSLPSANTPAVVHKNTVEAAKPILTAERSESSTSPLSGRPRPRAKPRSWSALKTPSAAPAARPGTGVNRAAQLITSGLAMASLPSELDKRLAAYSKRKSERTKQLTSRTREYKYASYMEDWRAKVERIGNLNYPDEARRKRLSGKLTLNVRLTADGSVKRVNVSKSSGQKVLDDAAIRIVRLSAPFAPFPPSFRDEIDYLDIHRTWRFSNTGRLAAN